MSQEQEKRERSSIVTTIVATIILVFMLFYFFTFQVRINERTVVTTFGKPTQSITEPGLYWKWPYPFQNIYIYDARLHTFVSKLEQILTSDHKSLIIQTYVGWRVENPEKFLIRVGRMEVAPESLEGLIRTYTTSVASRHMFTHLISRQMESGDNLASLKGFKEIENSIKDLINKGEGGCRENLGIVVEEFGIRTLKLPKNTTEKVFERMKAEQNRIAERFRSEGEAQYQKITSKAEAEKKKILIDTQAEAKRRRGEANAAAAEFYKVFAQDKELAIWLRKLEALEKLLGNKKTTLLLDPSTPPFDLLIKSYPNITSPKKASSESSSEESDVKKSQNTSEQEVLEKGD